MLHQLPEEMLHSLSSLMRRGGHEPSSGLQKLEFMAGAGFLCCFIGGAFLASQMTSLPGGASPLGYGLVLGLAGAAALPFAWLQRGQERQRSRLGQQVPQLLDLLVVAVAAGHGFESALQQVTRAFRGPLVVELDRVLERMLEGASLQVALDELAQRVSTPEIDSLVSTVLASRKMGTPLAEALRSQAVQLRRQRAQAAEEEARKAGVKVLFPLATCIMPVLLMLLLGPVFLGLFEAFKKLPT